MENQIKQLIELSRRYYDFGISYNLKDGEHNYLRGDVDRFIHLKTYPFTVDSLDDFGIRIYFNDNKETKAINFGKIEISEYSQMVSFPFDISISEIESVILNATEFLNSYLLNQPKPSEIEILKSKQEEIDEL